MKSILNFKPFDEMDLAELLEARDLQEQLLVSLREDETVRPETLRHERATL
jgi:hypothetical protein